MKAAHNQHGTSPYAIDFHALKAGERQECDFVVDDAFWSRWPESEITRGSAKVHVEVLKHPTSLELRVAIEGEVELVCDRCLEPFGQPIRFEASPLVQISEQVTDQQDYNLTGDNDGEVLWVSPADDTLDLAQYLYESVVLSLPFQRVHPDLTQCNPDMLERFSIESEGETDEEEK